jgi:uncharacterized membrane protein (DUF485 family)
MSRIVRGLKFVGRAYVWSIAGNFDEMKQNIKRIGKRLDQLKNHQYRQESFEEAIRRHGLSEENLKKKAEFLSAISSLYGLVAIISFMFLLFSYWYAHPYNHAVMSFGVLLIGSIRYLTIRFRIAQIRANPDKTVYELAALTGMDVKQVSVRNQRSRWGSCSAGGTISLNWRLVQTPEFVRDYIIYHELMHLREMNHSARFWARVAEVCPGWQDAERWIKRNGSVIGL